MATGRSVSVVPWTAVPEPFADEGNAVLRLHLGSGTATSRKSFVSALPNRPSSDVTTRVQHSVFAIGARPLPNATFREWSATATLVAVAASADRVDLVEKADSYLESFGVTHTAIAPFTKIELEGGEVLPAGVVGAGTPTHGWQWRWTESALFVSVHDVFPPSNY